MGRLSSGIEAQHLASSPLPSQVEGRVVDDAEEPRLEGRAPLEAGQVGERLDEPFLDRIERVRLVAEETIRDAVRMDPVATEQLLERRPLAAGEPDEQFPIIRRM